MPWQRFIFSSALALYFACLLLFSATAWAARDPLIVEALACCQAAIPPNPSNQASPKNPLQLNTDGGEKAQLVLRLSYKVEADLRVLSDPDRILLDLPEAAFRFDADNTTQVHVLSKAKNALIAGFRYGLVASARSRLVITLANPAIVTSMTQTPIDPTKPEGASLLTLECTKATRAQFLAALSMFAPDPIGNASASGQASLPLGQIAAPNATKGAGAALRPVIVLDPGHGGIDTGAIGQDNGEGKPLLEKDVVFAFAEMVAQKLKGSGRYEVVMTRPRDVFVPLGERVKIAERVGASLFMSIHADSLSGGRGDALVAGATVYTLSDKASDSEAAKIAQHENAADLAAGIKTQDAPAVVDDILFDLTRRETRVQSHSFANYLVKLMKADTPLNKNPTRSAGFQVLKAPDIPSVLVELGYLSSSQDSKRLLSPEWKKAASESILAAVDKFFRGDGAGIAPPVQ